MSFDALLDDLEFLQKAKPPHDEPDDDNRGGAPDGDEDDEKISEMAGEDDEEEDDDGDEDDDEYFGKSFLVTGEDGETVEAYDGTEMMKAFHERLCELERAHNAYAEKTRYAERELRKAEMIVSRQNQMMKSMRAQMADLQAQGRGRKSSLHVLEKPPIIPDRNANKPTPATVLTKAMEAQQCGRITGQDVARIESYLSRGLELPADLASFIN